MLAVLWKKILPMTRKLVVEYLLFFNILVFQNADTLKFVKGDSVVDIWLLTEKIQETDLGKIIFNKKSKVSKDNKYFFIYEEKYYPSKDSFFTKILFYDADKEKLWEKTPETGRKISFHLTNIYNDIVILVTTDKFNINPDLKSIKDNKIKEIIKEREYQRIIKYEFSSNMRYLILHIRNPYNTKMWDYIYSIDLQNQKKWNYLFPMCVSCKKNKIDLSIDNNGKAEVIYKGEHRIFSKDGELLDIFIKF